jgi:hypothetical protein
MKLILLLALAGTAASAQVGATIETLTMPKPGGETVLLHCVVTKVEPDGVRVTHDGGVAKVPYERMPESWKNAVPYDAASASEYRAKQNSSAQAAVLATEAEKKRQLEREAYFRKHGKYPPASKATWYDPAFQYPEADRFAVRIVSVHKDRLLVHKTQRSTGSYGPAMLLVGNLPGDVADGEVVMIQATKGNAVEYGNSTVREYTVLRFTKDLSTYY